MINDNQDANDVHMYSEWIHAVVDLGGGGGGGGMGGNCPPPPFSSHQFSLVVCVVSVTVYTTLSPAWR